MHIEIHLPRPVLTLSIVSGLVVFALWPGSEVHPAAVGGTNAVQAQVVREAEEDVKKLRLEQEVLMRREHILRAELEVLQEEELATHDPHLLYELYETRERLVALIQDQRRAEEEILASLRQIWEAQGYAFQASRGMRTASNIHLDWPVEPELGISARFEDDAYEERFGIPHHAIDIPAMQGTTVMAAADGVVMKVTDNGYGFNSLVIRHEGGFATLYGHVTEFLVQEGDDVRAGDPVALSGGRPGTKGAGRLTTGAHLHFEVLHDGEHADPLEYLPDGY